MKKELQDLKELKAKLQNCDLTQFKNYDEYMSYVKKTVYEYIQTHKHVSYEQLQSLLMEVKNEV